MIRLRMMVGCVFVVVCFGSTARLSAVAGGFQLDKMNNAWLRTYNLVENVEMPLRRPMGYETVTLKQLQSNPSYYVGRKVRVPLYFASIGEHYRPYQTRFLRNEYVNFYAWAAGIELWEPDQRRNVAFTFYVSRTNEQTIRVLDRLAAVPYAPIYIYGTVTNDHDHLPWIEVDTITVKDAPVHTRAALSQIELGIVQIEQAAALKYDARAYIIAVDAFEAALEMGLPRASESFVYRMLGETYLAMRDFSKSADALRKSIDRNADDVKTLLNLAMVEARLARETPYGKERDKHTEEAAGVSRKVVDEYPALADGHAVLGIVYALQGDWDKARREMNKARGLEPKLPEAYANLARMFMLRAEAAVRAKDEKARRDYLKKARDQYAQALEAKTEEPDYHFERGMVLLDIGEYDPKQLTDAYTEFNAYTSLLSNRPEGYYYLGIVERKRNHPMEAVTQMNSSIEKEPKYVQAYITKADILFNDLQDPKSALDTIDEARKELPLNSDLHFGMLKLGKQMSNWTLQSEAVDVLVKVLGDDMKVRMAAGEVYFNRSTNKEDKLKALAQYRKAIEIEADTGEKAPATAYLMAGHIMVRYQRHYKKGLEYIKLGLAREDSIQGRLDKALALMHLGDEKKSVAAARTARDMAVKTEDKLLLARADACVAYMYYLHNIGENIEDKDVAAEMKKALKGAEKAWKAVDTEALLDSPVQWEIGRTLALVEVRTKPKDKKVLEGAEYRLQRALELAPDDFVALYVIAEVKYLLGEISGDVRNLKLAEKAYDTAAASAKAARDSDIADEVRSLCKNGVKKTKKLMEKIKTSGGKAETASTETTGTPPQTPAAPTQPSSSDTRRRRRR